MGYTLKNLKISNFKYITDIDPLFVDFESGDIVVLNGQNGYGKTTVFDAIEILLTGRMNRITQILNKGNISTRELANDIHKNIVIEGLFNNEHEEVSIKRIVASTDQSTVYWNNEQISQEELFLKLKVSEELIRLGIYLSQSQSLDFLQNKYKDRKSKVSSLVENPDISRKVELIKSTETQFSKRVSEKSAEIKDEYDKIANRIKQINEDITKSERATGMTSEYVSLFEGKFPFDLPEIDTKTTFDSVVLPLRELRFFLSDYESFSITMSNGLVDRALNGSKHVYIKIFYRNAVNYVLDSKEKIESMNDCYSYLTEIESQKYVVNDNIFSRVGLDANLAQNLKEKIIEANEIHSNMGVLAKTISEIQDARKSLIGKYEKAVSDGHIAKDICPLCGAALKDAADSFSRTEKQLIAESEKNVGRYNAINNEIAKTFEEVVKPKIKGWLQVDVKLYSNYLFLRNCLTLDTTEIDGLLTSLGCTFCASDADVVDETLFETKYQELMTSIKALKKDPKSILEKDVIEKYKSLSALYFGGEQPKVTVENIDQKIGYIAKQYASTLYKELAGENAKLKSLTEKKEAFERETKKIIANIGILKKKYVDSQKEYQTNLVNDLRLPLLIYSGKIIQNYPLGLGIDMKVNENQLVFETAGKEGIDAFNILSTGQLNGLAISVMLAVRKVFGNSEGLDLIMIDDPLQTIDDISAISFTDMLINDRIGQVILSTHEERKARMMEYKFTQAGYKVCERNMKDMYIKTKLA